MLTALLLLGGLALLIVGGEMLVRGSVRVAEHFAVSPLLIGLTLVGFGTSTPELVTSVQAALVGSPGIAVGNIVGSNIANILLILGVSAVIFPLAVQSRALRRDGTFVIATALLFAAASLSFGLTRPTGVLFMGLLVGYMVYAYRAERLLETAAGPGETEHTAAFERGEAMVEADPGLRPHAAAASGTRLLLHLVVALAGLALIILGGRLLVDGAVALARLMGLSETVIGLTIVAVGTSMPELVTSVVAALRRHSDVALGNVLGSNIYNVLGIGGVTALIAPTPVPGSIAWFDNPVMIAASLLLFVFALSGRRLSRGEGGVLLALYAAYTAWLVGTSHA